MKYTIILIYIWLLAGLVLSVTTDSAEARPAYRQAQASYYTLFGNRTSCGKTMSNRAWHVAALKPQYAKCGMKVRICHKQGQRNYCVHVRVQDRGAWRRDNRVWDLTPRVKRALRCGDLCTVKYRMGWKR